MSRSVYVASPEGLTGKSAVALGLLDALIREVGSVGVFRPLTTLGGSGPDEEVDHIVEMLVAQPGTDQTYEEALGVTYAQAHVDPDEALHLIVERYGRLASRFRVMVVLGSDYTDVSTGTELSFNARVAANLGSPVVLVVHGGDAHLHRGLRRVHRVGLGEGDGQVLPHAGRQARDRLGHLVAAGEDDARERREGA